MTATFQQVFDLVMAGQTEAEIVRLFQELSGDERQALLCTLCHVRQEIADTSQEHGNTVSKLLSLCEHCVGDDHTCRLAGSAGYRVGHRAARSSR